MEHLRLRQTLTQVALIGVLMLGLAGLRWSQAADKVVQPVAPAQPSTLPSVVAPPLGTLQAVTAIATLDDVPGVTAHVYLVQGQVIVVSNVGIAMQTDLSPSPAPATTSPVPATTTR
jgi:hypothetical protein